MTLLNHNTNARTGARTNYMLVCHGCGSKGHKVVDCPHKTMKRSESKVKIGRYHLKEDLYTVEPKNSESFLCNGTINGIEVKNIMRDTGCDGIIVNSSVFPQVTLDNSSTTAILADYLGRENKFPVHKCFLNCICREFQNLVL